MCVNCGISGCGCNPSHIQIPVGPVGRTGQPGQPGATGIPGAAGKGISSSSYNASTGVLTITYTDATSYATGDLRGTDGIDGVAGASAPTDLYNLLNVSYANYNAYKDTILAKWQKLMHPTGLISVFAASTSNFSAGYGIDLVGGSNLLGWAICDGTTYTKVAGAGNLVSPDLRGKFVVGKAASGTFSSVGNQGGAETHVHTIDPLTTNQIPAHTHTGGTLTVNNHTHSVGTLSGTTSSEGNHRHSLAMKNTSGDGNRIEGTDTDGADTPHNIDAMGYAGDHSHTLTITGSTGNQNASVGLSGVSAVNITTEDGINTNAGSTLPPYFTAIYLIKL